MTRRGSQPHKRAIMLELMIKKVMNNHSYSFNGINKLQLLGGPIGLKLSGALAKVCMLSWSRRFLTTITAATTDLAYYTLHLLLFYVDDTNVVVDELEPGARYREGRVEVVEEEVEEDREVAGDLRTARVMLEIANSLVPYLQFTLDCPSLHPSGWMPLLDLQVRVTTNNRQKFSTSLVGVELGRNSFYPNSIPTI